MVDMQDLSISMHCEAPKRHLRSDVKTYIYAGCIVLLALIVFRAWITRDTVSSFHTDDTEISIQVFKNVGSVELLDANLGSGLILGPLTLNDVIELSNREFAVHLNELGQIAEISIDSELDESKRNQLDRMGLGLIELDGRTLIGLDSIENAQNPSTRLTIHALNPFFDGKVRSSDQNGWLSIHGKGLTLHGFGEKAEIRTELSIPEDTEIVAMISSTSVETELLNQSSNLITTPADLLLDSLSEPWKLIVASDENGKFYYSMLIEQTFDLEELAQVARYISSTNSLSTIALTLDDRTTVSEIRSIEEPTITITTEQDTHFIHVMQGEDELNLTQTPTHLLITNHDSSPSLDNIAIESECKSNAHTFAGFSLIIDSALTPSIASNFDSVAINSNSVFICW